MTVERHDWIPDHKIWFQLASKLFKDGKISHHVVCIHCGEKWSLVYTRGNAFRLIEQQCAKCGKQFRVLCPKMVEEQKHNENSHRRPS